MKKLYSALILMTLSSAINAQVLCMAWPGGCLDTIPALATVVTGSQTFTQDNSCFWVCPGDTLTIVGTNNSIYGEAGSAVFVEGPENFIDMKANGYVEIDSFSLACGVWFEASVTIVDNAPNTQKTPCGSVTFSYDSAPAIGCALAVIDPAGLNLQVHPNPASSTLHLSGYIPSGSTIEVLDLTGIYHRVDAATNIIDISHLEAGLYLVLVTLAGEVIMTDKLAVLR